MADLKEIASLETLRKLLKDIDSGITSVDEEVIKLDKDLQSLAKTITTNATSLESLTKGQDKAVKTSKEVDKVGKQVIATEKKINEVQSASGKLLVAKKVKLQQVTAETKRAIIQENALKGSYQAINAALNANINKYKALSAEQRNNSKAGKSLLRSIQAQDKALKGLDGQLGRSQRKVGNYKGAIMSSAKSLTGAFGLVGGVMMFAKVLKDSLAAIMDYQKAQSSLQAVSGKTKDELKELTKQAKLLGSQTEFTATQVTELQISLAKMGLTIDEIDLSTKDILNFATAVGADLGDAATTAATSLRVFGADASRMGEFVATLGVATTKSALQFSDYNTILSTAGPIAKAYGFSLQDLIAFTGKLKDSGFDASKASTAFKNIMLNLADANGDLAKALGRTVTNSDELIEGLIELREKGVSLNETLELTDKRSVAAFNTFLEGAEGAGELRNSITDVNEELQIMVDKKLDNLAGDITKLSSAWEGMVRKAEGGVSALRGVVKFTNNLVIQASNLDLVFKRAAKLSGDQASRFFDFTLSQNKKRSRALKELLADYEKATATSLEVGKAAFQEELRDIGFGKKEAINIYDEFVKRRIAQIEIEKRAVIDAEEAKEDALKKAALTKADSARVAAAKAAKINKKAEEKALAELEKLLKESLELERKGGLDRAKAQEQALKVLEGLEQELVDEDEDAQDDITKNLEKELKKRLDAKEYEHDKTLDLIEEERQAKEDLAFATSDLVTEGFNLANTFIERKIVADEQARDIEIAGIENSSRTEEAKTKAKETVNAKYNEKLVVFQRKQAINEKIAAIFSIGINTAVAVSKSLANPILAAVIGIIGALQLAAVAAKPVPKFAKGTSKAPGEFIAGDAGRELMRLPTGQMQMVDQPTYFRGSTFKGSKIFNNKETEEIMSQTSHSGFSGFSDSGMLAELRGLRKDVRNSSKPIVDRAGNVIGVKERGSITKFVNTIR